jgi:hypothetical protein
VGLLGPIPRLGWSRGRPVRGRTCGQRWWPPRAVPGCDRGSTGPVRVRGSGLRESGRGSSCLVAVGLALGPCRGGLRRRARAEHQSEGAARHARQGVAGPL